MMIPEFEKKYPNGYKNILYKKSKVEKFCKNHEPDGTILRITKYKDYEHKKNIMMLSMFCGTRDKLRKLIMKCAEGRIIEYFECGRKDSLKS